MVPFKFQDFPSVRRATRVLIGIERNYRKLWVAWIFSNISFPAHEHGLVFRLWPVHLLRQCFMVLSIKVTHLLASVHSLVSYSSWCSCKYRCFSALHSAGSLRVFRRITQFCILMSVFCNLTDPFIPSVTLVGSLGLSKCKYHVICRW